MTIRRATLMLPCRRLDELPTHLTGEPAAELLAAWTALWHPALIHATGSLPGWHSTDEPPDPSELDAELIVVPGVSRQRLAADWCDRLSATGPRNPPPVEAVASRGETVDQTLRAAGLEASNIAAKIVADFLALGHAHLQVELLTRAMRYTPVLDTDEFAGATVAAAGAAVAGNGEAACEELARAFDLLADARNHVYSVDFYVVDVTLLAASTLGETLRARLATGSPTSLLMSGELLDVLASEHPDTLAELRRAMEAGTACVAGGAMQGGLSVFASPEELLAEITKAQQAAQRHLERGYEIFGQFNATFSPLLPEILAGSGYRGALFAAFDGGQLPRAEQCKTWWGSGEKHSIEALTASPLDAARPETWLKLGERIGDTIAHDHVATVLLASWPGTECEYYDDLRCAGRYNSVLGKLVTLEEYFRATRQPDDWTSFYPREYPPRSTAELGPNPISSQVETYRREVSDAYRRLGAGLAATIDSPIAERGEDKSLSAVINPWNFPCTQFVGSDPIGGLPASDDSAFCLPDTPGCGYATFAAAAPAPAIALVDGCTLRNERIELTVSETTGGIQSLRTHRDRGTRISQRLVFHHGWSGVSLDTQMLADKVETTRNDALVGEITSRGRLLDEAGELLARFTQTTRIARGLAAVFIDVLLEPERLPEGDIWRSYYASRLAWGGDAVSVRCGRQWMARETARERIESPEWVEVNDGVGTVTCFGLGLPLHRRATMNWLDTLLLIAGERERRFQFALAIDEVYPTCAALALLTAGQPFRVTFPNAPNVSRGWFVHVGSKNVVVTHIRPLAMPAVGVRLRVLETEGRDAHTSLSAFRPIRSARITDFRGNSTGVLSVSDGRVDFDIGAHRWIQIEAEW